MTRAIVVGGGSIGMRHARVLTGLGHEVVVVTQRTDLDVPAVASVADAGDAGYAVVATETARHAASVTELADAGFAGLLLVEKPLGVDPASLGGFERVGVAFNLRFHPVIAALAAALDGRRCLTVEAYVGQHLSTWRPDRPVAEQYSAHQERGGGALRDLSHELDYLVHLFGNCTGVFARGGRYGEVTVDADDAWGIVAEHERAPLVTVQLNYLDTTTRRRLVINTGAETLEADLVAGTLTIDGETTAHESDRDHSYRALHVAMLGDGAGVTSVDEAAVTDALIERIERSAASREWVTA